MILSIESFLINNTWAIVVLGLNDYFNRLKKEHMAGLTDFFKGRLVAGQDNLYGMLGSGASDPNFLKQYMYKLVSGKG